MNYKSVVDISAIIWDSEDYQRNTSEYFKLKEGITSLINSFRNERPVIVLRAELAREMVQGFPYYLMPNKFHEFGTLVFDFLTGIPDSNRILFAGSELEISSLPDIVKEYFNANTQLEAKYLITYLHTERNAPTVYFTFQYLHGSDEALATFPNSNGNAKLITETIFADDLIGLEKFFKKYKRIFEHSPKHHAGHEHGDYVSPLSCYDGHDTSLAQKYLEGGILEGKRYYNFDLENDVYVVFFPSGGNSAEGIIYHGHDEINKEKIPSTIRRRFHK